MNCGAFRKQISMLVDGTLDKSTAVAAKLHMKECADCRQFRDRIVALDETLRSGATTIPNAALAEKIKANFAAHRARQLGREFFPAWSRVPLAAMVVLLALGLGNLAGQSLNDMFSYQRADAFLDQLMPDQNGWVSDAFIEMGAEENSR
jgi:predicted anti-sigma-YlaC factor YlaD